MKFFTKEPHNGRITLNEYECAFSVGLFTILLINLMYVFISLLAILAKSIDAKGHRTYVKPLVYDSILEAHNLTCTLLSV